MREIKFRGYSKTKECWIYGLPEYSGDEIHAIQTKYRTAIQVDPKSLGQYTGMEDTDGKEVYEMDLFKDANGEIFEMKFGVNTRVLPMGDFRRAKIAGCGWYLEKVKNKGIVLATECQYVEVVGNIYENPELAELENGDLKE